MSDVPGLVPSGALMQLDPGQEGYWASETVCVICSKGRLTGVVVVVEGS